MVRFRRKVIVTGLLVVIMTGLSESISDLTNIMKIEAANFNQSDLAHVPNFTKNIIHTNEEQKDYVTVVEAEDYDVTEPYIPYDLQIVADAFSKLNNSQCIRDGRIVLESVARREKWALEIFDSSSKFPVGILHGAFYQMGNFDECIEAKQPNHLRVGTSGPIQGQYCLTDVELRQEKEENGRVVRSFNTHKEKPRNAFGNTIHWGICLPSSCSQEQVQELVKEIFMLATDHSGISVKVKNNMCQYTQSIPLTVLEIVYGCVIGVFLMFILLATVFHYYSIQRGKNSFAYSVDPVRTTNDSTVKEIVLCFSVIKTVGKFLKTKPSGSNLDCICGIRFLSMLFIIAGHSLLHMIGGPVMNTNFYDQESINPANAIFTNSPLLVDTFLLISGFLMSHLLLIELDKRKGQLNFLILYIARYIRLTPSYIVVIGLYCTFLVRLGSGPLWQSRIGLEQERCLQSWWANLLYINNYVNTGDICMFQSWYLSVDYHLFIIAPFLIYPLRNWNKLGKLLLILCTLLSVVVPFWITYREKLDPTLMSYASEVYDISKNFYFVTAYIKTHMRAGAYFLGLIFGYLVYKLQTAGTKISSYIIWCGWVIAPICGIVSMFSVTIFYLPGHEYNPFEAAVYTSLHRVAWCIAIGWVLVACITDNAALINRFLSWKPFIPLSRLTYCAYLVNGLIEIYSLGTIRTGIYMSKYELANKTIAHALITFFAAFLLCIFFESPIHGLEKILLRKDGKQNHSEKTERIENEEI